MNAFLRSRRWFVIAVSTFIAGSEVAPTQEAKRSEVLIADFEAESYGDWNAEGEAFGSGPAEGTLMCRARTRCISTNRLPRGT